MCTCIHQTQHKAKQIIIEACVGLSPNNEVFLSVIGLQEYQTAPGGIFQTHPAKHSSSSLTLSRPYQTPQLIGIFRLGKWIFCTGQPKKILSRYCYRFLASLLGRAVCRPGAAEYGFHSRCTLLVQIFECWVGISWGRDRS